MVNTYTIIDMRDALTLLVHTGTATVTIDSKALGARFEYYNPRIRDKSQPSLTARIYRCL